MTSAQFYRTTTIISIIIILFLVNCQGEKETKVITVTIPEKSGSFDFRDNPAPVTKEQPGKHPKPEIIREQVIDSSYYFAYISLQDSIERQKMFEDAIMIRQYFERFEDENQKIDVYTDVRGSMLSQKVDYTIFETQTDVEVEIPRYNQFYLSGGIRSTFPIETPVAVLKGVFINKNNRMLGLEAGTDKSFGVFYGIKF